MQGQNVAKSGIDGLTDWRHHKSKNMPKKVAMVVELRFTLPNVPLQESLLTWPIHNCELRKIDCAVEC